MAAVVAFACAAGVMAAPTLNVGSKRFTESYVLGEILKQSAQAAGETSANHSQGLGNTAIVLNALTTGSIDVYPEYTGTIAKEILKSDKYGLTVLEDDRKYFPRHDAVLLYRADLPQRLPKTWVALAKLEASIDDASMRRMNAAAELENKDFATVAKEYLTRQPGAAANPATAATASASSRASR